MSYEYVSNRPVCHLFQGRTEFPLMSVASRQELSKTKRLTCIAVSLALGEIRSVPERGFNLGAFSFAPENPQEEA
jgi:hypothetical protein